MPHQTMSMLPDQRTARLAGMLAFTIVAGALSGDELRFRDGDVLTGNFVRSEEGRIIFDSVVFGRISVAEADVQLVRTDAPAGMPARPLARIEPKEAPAEQEPLVPAAAAPVTTGAVAAVTRDDAAAAPARAAGDPSLLRRMLQWVNPFKGWKSKFSVGYAWESTGVRTEDLTLIFDAQRKIDGSELKFNVRYEYGNRKVADEPAQLARDRLRGSLRYRNDIGERLFFQADTDYQKDRIKGIEHEFRMNSGLGWRVFIGEPLTASLVPKLTLRYKELQSVNEEWDFLFTLSQDLRYRITDRVSFIESASISWNPDHFDRSVYSLMLKLENRITDQVFVDLSYETEFDYEVDVGLESKSQRVLVLVSYVF
jgi:putative salt-induced outer membrane protein YdiY